MNYKETVEKINSILKENRAAISIICRKAGQVGRSAYYNALKKEDWNDLTPSQRKVIEEALEYIERMKGDNPDPTAMKAAEILN